MHISGELCLLYFQASCTMQCFVFLRAFSRNVLKRQIIIFHSARGDKISKKCYDSTVKAKRWYPNSINEYVCDHLMDSYEQDTFQNDPAPLHMWPSGGDGTCCTYRGSKNPTMVVLQKICSILLCAYLIVEIFHGKGSKHVRTACTSL